MVVRIWTVNANSHARISSKVVPKGNSVGQTALLDTEQEVVAVPAREKKF